MRLKRCHFLVTGILLHVLCWRGKWWPAEPWALTGFDRLSVDKIHLVMT